MKYNKYKILIVISVIVLSLFVVATFLPITEGYDVRKNTLKAVPPPFTGADKETIELYNQLKTKRTEITDLGTALKPIIREIASYKFTKKPKAYRDAKKSDRDTRQKNINTKVAAYHGFLQMYINGMNIAQNQSRSGSGPGSPGSIENAAPHYPLYKFKGCWTHGHDIAYPILDSRLVFGNVKNMEECVERNSKLGMPTAAYDGTNICMGGMFDYKPKTAAKCVNTYPNGKSWLVYSKSAM